MYLNGFTTAKDIVKDIVTSLCTGDELDVTNNWELVAPADLGDITNEATVKITTKVAKQWVKREQKNVSAGKITLNDTIVDGGGTRVFVRDKKYFLYLRDTVGELDVMEYRISGANEIEVHTVHNSKGVLVDYEKSVDIDKEYFVKFTKPATATIGGETTPNHYFLEWVIGEDEDFSTGHKSMVGKLNWFKETAAAKEIAQDWLPIEYWLSFDKNACAGVVMGDPGLSISEWLSSPFYFGSLEQIEGALETDLDGNFGGFSGSFTPPTLYKDYGDYTGTGITDVTMVKTKTKRPYQAHKVAVFGAYEFREKTFNGQSMHTGKHPVSDIVVADTHENDRGILRHCLAVPRVAKEHMTELIYNRYMSGKEQVYVFLNINVPYTPFQTGPDCLLGFAIRKDV